MVTDGKAWDWDTHQEVVMTVTELHTNAYNLRASLSIYDPGHLLESRCIYLINFNWEEGIYLPLTEIHMGDQKCQAPVPN